MKGSYTFESIKFGFAIVGSLLAKHLGGFDVYLNLLVIMILTDIVTGVLKGVVTKQLASKQMKCGIIRKFLIFICVMLAFEINNALAIYAAEAGIPYNIDIRLFIILYFILEELLSVLENIAQIGVPLPKFIISVLKVVVDTTQNSTPQRILKLFGKIKKLDWIGLNEFIKKDEEQNNNAEDSDFAKPGEFDTDQNNKGI